MVALQEFTLFSVFSVLSVVKSEKLNTENTMDYRGPQRIYIASRLIGHPSSTTPS